MLHFRGIQCFAAQRELKETRSCAFTVMPSDIECTECITHVYAQLHSAIVNAFNKGKK